MDRILIILKKENDPRASSAPALGLNTIIFKHDYWYMQQTQVSVYRTIGPLVFIYIIYFSYFCSNILWVHVETYKLVPCGIFIEDSSFLTDSCHCKSEIMNSNCL